MKNLMCLFSFLLVFLFSQSTHGQVAIINGELHLFSVDTPDGWTLDRKLARQIGLVHIIYPQEEKTEKNLFVYIYALGADRPKDSKKGISSFIDGDTNSFHKKIPGLKIIEQEIKLTNISQNTFLTGKYYIFKFIHPSGRNECVAYIDAKDTVVTIIFSANTEDKYKKYFNDYEKVLNSFIFLGRNGNIITIE